VVVSKPSKRNAGRYPWDLMKKRRIMKLIDLPSKKSFVDSVISGSPVKREYHGIAIVMVVVLVVLVKIEEKILHDVCVCSLLANTSFSSSTMILFISKLYSKFCSGCQAQFGAYHCDICNLWMSDDESPYHCSDCGFCRVGGRENFRHCDDCGMCIDTLLFDDHNCKAGKYMSNCPVCQEDLFSSRDASHEMPCGHAIHWHCFKELTSYDTRCPVCKKTAETPEHMAPTWQAMAMGIALQPVPPELARVVTIICNDCEQRDSDRRWHFLGVRCHKCMSFNTTIERTTMTGREAAGFLDDLDAAQGSRETSSEMNEDVHMHGEGHEGHQ
jgi:RING finger/CHY zinc finger protein 1